MSKSEILKILFKLNKHIETSKKIKNKNNRKSKS